jgi:hypothetical protein
VGLAGDLAATERSATTLSRAQEARVAAIAAETGRLSALAQSPQGLLELDGSDREALYGRLSPSEREVVDNVPRLTDTAASAWGFGILLMGIGLGPALMSRAPFGGILVTCLIVGGLMGVFGAIGGVIVGAILGGLAGLLPGWPLWAWLIPACCLFDIGVGLTVRKARTAKSAREARTNAMSLWRESVARIGEQHRSEVAEARASIASSVASAAGEFERWAMDHALTMLPGFVPGRVRGPNSPVARCAVQRGLHSLPAMGVLPVRPATPCSVRRPYKDG